MSIRDPFYIDIEEALARTRLDPDLFERFAAELVESKGYPTNFVAGGGDDGYDFELLDNSLEPGPGVVTTSDRVTTNLKRNLDRNLARCPNGARKTYVVTSSDLSTTKRRNLKKAAVERGYIYLGASGKHEVAKYIYTNPHWARELLGLTGSPSALSMSPRTSRPILDVPMVGREDVEKRLRTLDEDMLLVGSPGCGKTSVLARLAAEGIGTFLASNDKTLISNAVRKQDPPLIIVDDLGDVVGATRDLIHIREEIGARFRIVVTDWEENPEVQELLGLRGADIIRVAQLARDEIVQVVNSVGVQGPTELVREIVNQAEGIPGLAITLTQAALAGDYHELFDGKRLGILMESTVQRLLGSTAEGHHAITVLGTIALAGDSGFALEQISTFVGCSKSELQGLLRRLTSGGLIRSERRRISLRPRPLRRYMIRKAFFEEAPVDYVPLLSMVPNPGQTATELVLVTYAGATIPGLLDLVVSSGSTIAARYYVGSGPMQARELLRTAPNLAQDVAKEALYSAPDAIIPLLLDLAVGDTRPLHNTTDHPLRLIKDWANSGVPGSDEAIMRKRTTIECALRWGNEGKDLNLALRACTEVLSTVSEIVEMDPGAGTTMRIWRGLLTDDEVAHLYPLWERVKAAIKKAETVPWPFLLSMCDGLVHPGLLAERSPSTFEASRLLAKRVISDLGAWSRAHPGVLQRLNMLIKQLGNGEIYPIPEDYSILCGENDPGDWKDEEKRRHKKMDKLAKKWAQGKPATFAARLKWLLDEAKLAGHDNSYRTLRLCSLIARRAPDSLQWLYSLIEAGHASAWILPFLEKAVESEPSKMEPILLNVLDTAGLEAAVIDVALSRKRLTKKIWIALSPALPHHRESIKTLCLRNRVPPGTLRRLLRHDSSEVACATAVGMWAADNRGSIPHKLRDDWQAAIVRAGGEEYWLAEMFAGNPTLAEQWLTCQIQKGESYAFFNRKSVGAACAELNNEQRLEVLFLLHEHSQDEDLVAALIGGSEELYRQVATDPILGDFWRGPLRGKTDKKWYRFATIAIAEGRTPQEVASASMLHFASWSGRYSEFLQSRMAEVSVWIDDANEGIREVATQIVERLRAEEKEALKRERIEAVEGIR